MVVKEICVKLNKEDLLSIRFGLGIAEAWNDQKLDKGYVTCMSKSQYYAIVRKLDYYYDNYDILSRSEIMVFLIKIHRIFRKMHGFLQKMNRKEQKYHAQDHVSI